MFYYDIVCLHPCTGSQYAVLGPACNKDASLTAQLTSNYFHVVQVSYGADTPLLSNIEDFLQFYRTVPSYLSFQTALAAVMEQFEWRWVGVIHQESPYYTVALETFNSYLTRSIHGARVIGTQGVSSLLDLERTLGEARIIIVMAPENMAAAILCTAYHLQMTGRQYQWILLGDYQEGWWKQKPKLDTFLSLRVSCSERIMLEAVESTLILTYNLQLEGVTDLLQSGQTMDEFWTDFAAFFNTTSRKRFKLQLAMLVPSTYDAVWSIALALNKTLSTDSVQLLSESQNNSNFNLSLRLNSAMETLDFQGASGRTAFTHGQHSQLPPATHVSQMQNGSIVFVGIHNEREGALNLSNNLLWQSAKGPPRDRPRVNNETVEIYLVEIMLVIVSLGIILCVVFAIINCYYRKHKVIKASSPYINIFIITGCLMGFASVILISIENIDAHLDIAPASYHFLCNARPWFLSLGYTLAFGALFAKSWRIYSIFKNPWKRNRPLKDHVLIGIIGILLSIDVVILVVWVVLDPLDLYAFTIDTDEDSFTQERHFICSERATLDLTSDNFSLWIVILMTMKGCLLLFGLYIVSRTGSIKAEVFKDTKYTAVAIYGVGICCAIGVPTALILMYNFLEDPGYIVATATISFCSYLILLMVFVPKIILLRKYKKQVPTAVLIGLNPSFRIRKRPQYLSNNDRNLHPSRKRAPHALNATQPGQRLSGNYLESASAVSFLNSPAIDSQADVNLIPPQSANKDHNDKSYSGILEGWEPAIEGNEKEHSSAKIYEMELLFENIAYIASITFIEDESNSNTIESSSQDIEPTVNVFQQNHVTTDGDSSSVQSATLEASRSSFSIDYTTTCVVEIHSDT